MNLLTMGGLFFFLSGTFVPMSSNKEHGHRSVFFDVRRKESENSTSLMCLVVTSNKNTLGVEQCGLHPRNEVFKLHNGLLYSPQAEGCLNPHTMVFDQQHCWSTDDRSTSMMMQWRWIESSNKQSGALQSQTTLQCVSNDALFQQCNSDASSWFLSPRTYAVDRLFIASSGDSVAQTCDVLLKETIKKTKEVKIAFFLRGTKSSTSIIRLLIRIHRPKHTYLVHLDQSTSEHEILLLDQHIQQYENVNRLKSEAVHYMSFDLMFLDVRAILYFLHDSSSSSEHSDDPPWDYFVNLSAQEYPLTSMASLERMLSNNYGKNFVDVWCNYNDAPSYKKGRIDDLFFRGKKLSLQGMAKQAIRLEEKPSDVEFMFGSFYVLLTRTFVDSLFYDPIQLNMLTYLRYVRVPDEVFFATALMNSKEYKCTHINTNLRYINWGRATAFEQTKCPETGAATTATYGKRYLEGGSHPCILGMRDVLKVMERRDKRGDGAHPWLFFGNKFDHRVDSKALAYLDKRISATAAQHTTALHSATMVNNFELSERPTPARLHCPVYKGKGY